MGFNRTLANSPPAVVDWVPLCNKPAIRLLAVRKVMGRHSKAKPPQGAPLSSATSGEVELASVLVLGNISLQICEILPEIGTDAGATSLPVAEMTGRVA